MWNSQCSPPSVLLVDDVGDVVWTGCFVWLEIGYAASDVLACKLCVIREGRGVLVVIWYTVVSGRRWEKSRCDYFSLVCVRF